VSRRFGLTALMLAAAHKQADSVRLLLAAGADVNAKNDDGSTALMAASLKGDINVVRMLLDANADVNVRDKDGDSL
jgi:FOG: Ankyrin repeat